MKKSPWTIVAFLAILCSVLVYMQLTGEVPFEGTFSSGADIPTDSLFYEGERNIVDCPGMGYLTSTSDGDGVIFKCDWDSHDMWELVVDTTITPTEEILALHANPWKNRNTLTVVKKYMGDDQWHIQEVWKQDLRQLAREGGSCTYSRMGQCAHHKLVWKRNQ